MQMTAFSLFFGIFCCVAPSQKDSTVAVAEPPSLITWTECSNTIQQHPCDIEAINQLGSTENLYDYVGRPIVLDLSATWCGPCRAAALEVQATQDKYSDIDLAYITILIENNYGQPPNIGDLEAWANSYGITTAPILAGSRDLLNPDPKLGWELHGWPTFYFIDSEMVLRGYLRGFSTAAVEQGIDQIKGESQ